MSVRARDARRGWRLEASAFLGFFERQRNLYRRYWAWELVWFVYSLVSVLTIGYLATGLSVSGSAGHLDLARTRLYLLVGSVLWSYMAMVFFEVSFAISWERWEGTIEYTMMAPVRRVTHLLGICWFGIVYGLVRTALTVLIVALLFRLDLSHANLAAAGLVLVAATLPILGLGVFTAILPLLSPEKGDQMAVAVQGLLLLVSGVYYPLQVLPFALRVVGQASPLTYTLSGMRAALLTGAGAGDLAGTIGLLVGIGAVLITAGFIAFGRAENRAKRLGLLKRSG